ncbi:MAG: primosomal replication protein N [Burkholderiales bacterium]|nr:primosomal replication protein N [Burkholderiales bacterium]
MNVLNLVASITERSLVRYTPSGVPVLQLQLSHSGEVMEAGKSRQVEFEIQALALGDTALSLDRSALGETFHFSGFMAKKTRNSKNLQFHISGFGLPKTE